MVIRRQLGLRLLLLAAAAGVVTTVPAVLTTDTSTPAVRIVGTPPCVNGVVPVNPHIVNCNLPPRGPRIPGQAPDAGAIIACRGHFGCLSYYVNYPGATWGPFTPPA
jgi:hypothetical protein